MSNFTDCPRGTVAMAAARRLECEPGDLLHLRAFTECGEDEAPEEDYDSETLAAWMVRFIANLDSQAEKELSGK